jgi:hypothetical protein
MGKLFKFLVYALILTVPSLASCTNNEKIDEQALYEEAQKAIDSYPGNQDGLRSGQSMLSRQLPTRDWLMMPTHF